ncbi:GNAT family N-acetyltransferase [Paenibacillus chondroitinus]|uniref:GNAT family N-acetyltransferase n=1 Tax=Paenibacillus chondroitinus TaxID=59842 RepID=A0ABU6DIE8_9BACL|nr:MULTISPECIES: GNAT family N-acetyltransferase [Paenibacillus]MCY9657761.1 GNAT family N-acetyltransferase [Paenibacillus anseongense]MEB4797528.1 GNAT family N-acetyltransferase [Paenibacillus chondroitinus]
MMHVESLFSSFPFIYTERLVLRQMDVADAEDIYAFYSDPQVTKHLDWHGPSSIEDTRMLIDSWNQAFADRRLISWGISFYPSESRHIIGTITLMPTRGIFDADHRYPLTVGYDLQTDYWGKGIMSEAMQAVIHFSKTHISPHRIQAEVYPENVASLKLLKKLGFQEEGLLKQYLMHEVTKTFLDVVLLALLFN